MYSRISCSRHLELEFIILGPMLDETDYQSRKKANRGPRAAAIASSLLSNTTKQLLRNDPRSCPSDHCSLPPSCTKGDSASWYHRCPYRCSQQGKSADRLSYLAKLGLRLFLVLLYTRFLNDLYEVAHSTAFYRIFY